MGTKLANHNLDFRGCKIPVLKSAIKESISDLFSSCVAEGAEDLVLPQKPQTYTALVTELIDLGLIEPSSSSLPSHREVPRAPFAVKSTAVLAVATPSLDDTENVLDANRTEVYFDSTFLKINTSLLNQARRFIMSESLTSVEDSSHADVAIQNVSEFVDINTTNLESIGPSFGLDLPITDANTSHDVYHVPANSSELSLQASFNTLKEEHEKDKGYTKELETQISQMNEKMLVLENQRSTGKIPHTRNWILLTLSLDNTVFLTALKDEIKTTMREGFVGLEVKLMSNIRTELRAELSRFNQFKLNVFSIIKVSAPLNRSGWT